MLKKMLVPGVLALALLTSCSENNEKLGDSGIEYRFVEDKEGRVAKPGDLITVSFTYKTPKDSVLQTSAGMGGPQLTRVSPPGEQQSLIEKTLAVLSEGDSAIFYIPSDSLFKGAMPGQRPPFLPEKSMLTFEVRVNKLENVAERGKNEKQKLKDYGLKKGVQVKETPSGLMYAFTNEGAGLQAEAGDSVTVQYKGMFTDENVFDPGNRPFTFKLGQGAVIKGWEEGIALMKEGTKGLLLVPYELGYGEYGSPPVIPAYSSLVFEVELLKVKKNKDSKAITAKK